MNLQTIKKISYFLLVIIWYIFFFTGNKDIILLISLLVLNGALIEKKNEMLVLIVIFAAALYANLFKEVNQNDNLYKKSFYILILFCLNFLSPFFIGLLFSKVLKAKNFFHPVIIWFFTFIISQALASFLNKSFMDTHFWIIILIFNLNYFIAGFYISNLIKSTKSFLKLMIVPLIFIPIIILTSNNNYLFPIIFLFSIILSNTLGFIISKFFNKETKED